MYPFLLITTSIIMLISCYTDLTTYKVLNIVTFPTIIIGLVCSFSYSKTEFLIRFIIIVLLFFLSGLNLMGMGDVKLCMAVTAMMGPDIFFNTLLFGALFMIWYCLIHDYSDMIRSLKMTKDLFLFQIPITRFSSRSYPFAFFLSCAFPLAVYLEQGM